MIAKWVASALLFASVPAAEAPFQDLSFDQALETAKREGKIVMIDFFTTWCVPCKKLDKTTWKDPDVQQWLAEKTVPLKIDAEKEAKLAQQFAVGAYPTIVFIQADGTKMDAIVGYKSPEDFLAEAKDLLGGKSRVDAAKEKLAGHEKDPMARGRYADELARAGKHAEALAEYLWCFDEGKSEPAYHGVRLSFLLADIKHLGETYPPAIDALKERRDKAEAALLAPGGGNFDVAADMTALNRELGEPARILKIYDRLKEEKRLSDEIRRPMIREIAEFLAKEKRYAELIEAAGDAEKVVEYEIWIHRSMPEAPVPGSDPQLRKALDAALAMQRVDAVDDLSVWYEAFLGAKEREKAARVADRLLEFSPVVSTYGSLVRRATKAGALDEARALVERGRKELPAKDHDDLDSMAKKIPAPK